ncbi:MAG: 50S ribosomal protein L11 methyltransferase [Dysgonamonadaceae bacterium]|jgi:ribosomal protein L11 methyltransferase|nr:50S ribosomal protein L11 methyltransferase [Dysgonamonadaceae bacterium]
MNYYELKIVLSPNTETNRDILAALLAEIGFESFVEFESGLDAYVSEKNYSEEAVSNLLNDLPLIDAELEYTTSCIETLDWNEEWEKNFFQPIIIDDKCVIHSSFHKDIPTLPYDIVIDPKMAFGTGHHETTSLMVSYLLQLEINNRSFLDMGCGTAVLAILAKMCGSARTLAIDNDEWAYQNSLENVQLNHTEAIEVLLGDAGLLGKEKFDIIFANINRNILLADIHIYASCMKRGSKLYMSGFYSEDLDLICKECKKNGLQFIDNKVKNNWTAAVFQFI